MQSNDTSHDPSARLQRKPIAFEVFSLAAHRCHQWAWSQLILNQRIISASGVSIKKTDQVQRHLFKSNGFSKFGRKSGVTPLSRKKLQNIYVLLEFTSFHSACHIHHTLFIDSVALKNLWSEILKSEYSLLIGRSDNVSFGQDKTEN